MRQRSAPARAPRSHIKKTPRCVRFSSAPARPHARTPTTSWGQLLARYHTLPVHMTTEEFSNVLLAGRAGTVRGEEASGGARAAKSFLQSRAGALTHLPHPHPHPHPSPLFRPTASSAWARPARPGRKPGAGGPSRWTPKVREEEGGRAQRGAGALASLFFFDLRARPPALSLTPRPPPTLPTLQTSPPSSGRPPPGAATSP